MKLVLQCAVCGTVHPVGMTTCVTCRATGFKNLRLLFECPRCFELGLVPHCTRCAIVPHTAVYSLSDEDEENEVPGVLDAEVISEVSEATIAEEVDEDAAGAILLDDSDIVLEYDPNMDALRDEDDRLEIDSDALDIDLDLDFDDD